VLGNELFWKNMLKIDANILLRYLLDDHAEFSFKAREIIDKHTVEVPIEVLCEVIYVLTGHYSIDRQNVSTELIHFFDQTQCILSHRGAVLRGLQHLEKILWILLIVSWQGILKLRKMRYILLIINFKN
jgi:predicted nucleic acid-binding protein